MITGRHFVTVVGFEGDSFRGDAAPTETESEPESGVDAGSGAGSGSGPGRAVSRSGAGDGAGAVGRAVARSGAGDGAGAGAGVGARVSRAAIDDMKNGLITFFTASQTYFLLTINDKTMLHHLPRTLGARYI